MTTTAAAPAAIPPENLSFFGYARNFTVGLIKDAKFWSRFNAIPNGVIFIAQAVAGAMFLVASAPLIAQVPGIAACAALAGIGLYGIGYGFPRAWQSMEALCTKTFPTFNPLKKIRIPVQALAHKLAETKLAKKLQAKTSFLARLKPKLKTEHQQDMFLAALTMEGASAAAIACGIAIAPHVMALPAITIAGGIAIAGAGWIITTCLFDVYCSGKTLFEAYRDRKKQQKHPEPNPQNPAPPAPAPQPANPKPAPASPTASFNQTADRKPEPAARPLPPAAQAQTPSFPSNKPNCGPDLRP